MREQRDGLVERIAAQVRRPLMSTAAARNEAGPLEHLEVLAQGLQRDGGGERGELVDRRVAVGQAGQHRPPGRVSECAERDVRGRRRV